MTPRGRKKEFTRGSHSPRNGLIARIVPTTIHEHQNRAGTWGQNAMCALASDLLDLATEVSHLLLRAGYRGTTVNITHAADAPRPDVRYAVPVR